MKEETGLVAIESKLGWILSGVVETKKSNIGHNNANEVSVTNLILQQEVGLRDKTDELKTQLQRFWEMETIGIHDIAKESSAPKNEEFLSHIANDGKRYSVKLPWKPDAESMPNHYDLCCQRLDYLHQRLKKTEVLMNKYDTINKKQQNEGVAPSVPADERR